MTGTASPTRTGRRGARPRRRSAGFTYLSLVILVAIIGLAGATTLKVGVLMQRSAAERELLNIGAQFSDALQSYAQATPAGQPTQPPSLKELLHDPRFPGMRRHLRKIFVDPMTGQAEWGIQYVSGTTGVVAVYSLSEAKAIKIANFPARFHAFEGKERVADWRFARTGDAIASPGQPRPGQPAQPNQPVPAPPAAAMPGTAPATPANPAPPPEPPEPPAEPDPPAEPPPPPQEEPKPEPEPSPEQK